MATMDAHSRVKIVDRTKDIIKNGDEWTSSMDMENSRHPASAGLPMRSSTSQMPEYLAAYVGTSWNRAHQDWARSQHRLTPQ